MFAEENKNITTNDDITGENKKISVRKQKQEPENQNSK